MITTTALLADLTNNVGGGLIEVRSIVPPGADVHSFQTTPDDSVAIGKASIIVSNGFGLDAFLEPVIRSAGKADASYVVAAEGLDSASAAGPELGGDGPHLWQNPVFTIHYVERIRDGLAAADPGRASDYRANADAYIRELRELDREIARILGQVPPEHRRLVTFHDAFGHFGSRYGWQVSSFVAGDAGTVSPATIVAVLDGVKSDGLPAVFMEPQFRSEVIERGAEDAGVAVGTVYSDLRDEGAANYLAMMRSNARTLADYLK